VFLWRLALCSSFMTRVYSSLTWSYSEGSPSCDQWLSRETTLLAACHGASARDFPGKVGARDAGLVD
jgi:hypothetical protein